MARTTSNAILSKNPRIHLPPHHRLGARSSNELTIRLARAVTFASATMTSGAYSTSNAACTEPAIRLAWRSDQNRKSSGSDRLEVGVAAGLEVVSESEEEDKSIPELSGTRDGSESRQRVTMRRRVRRTDSKSSVAGLSTWGRLVWFQDLPLSLPTVDLQRSSHAHDIIFSVVVVPELHTHHQLAVIFTKSTIKTHLVLADLPRQLILLEHDLSMIRQRPPLLQQRDIPIPFIIMHRHPKTHRVHPGDEVRLVSADLIKFT